MYSGGISRTASQSRLLVLALAFLSSSLAALLAITCFVLALDKHSDPNGAVSLPGGQKFTTFFTAGTFLAALPVSLLIFIFTFFHDLNRPQYPTSPFDPDSKVYESLTFEGLSPPPPPIKPFWLTFLRLCRIILAIAILIQAADIFAFLVIVCIRRNTSICLFNHRVVLCHLLSTPHKLFIVIPGFIQILAQIALFLLIGPYTRSLETKTTTTTKPPKDGKRDSVSFKMVPGFDPDLEKDSDLTDLLSSISSPESLRYDYNPVNNNVNDNDIDTAKELRLNALHSALFNVPTLSATGNLNFADQLKLKLTRSSSSGSGSHMTGPRPAPAPKRASSVLQSTPAPVYVAPPTRKNKEWFKRFKSKTVESVPAEDEDADEGDALVSDSRRIRSENVEEKLEVTQEEHDQDDEVVDVQAL